MNYISLPISKRNDYVPEDYSILFNLIKKKDHDGSDGADEDKGLFIKVYKNIYLNKIINHHLQLYNKHNKKEISINDIESLYKIENKEYIKSIRIMTNYKENPKYPIPNSLTSIAFYYDLKEYPILFPYSVTRLQYNEYYMGQKIPPFVLNLEFQSLWKHTLTENDIPLGVTHIEIGRANINLTEILPTTVTSLKCPSLTSEILRPGDIPSTIKTLSLGLFDRSLFPGDLPLSITNLTFNNFNQILKISSFPKHLKTLYLYAYNHPLEKNILPKTLVSLTMICFNKVIKKDDLHEGLEYLQFGYKFNQSLVLPNSIKTLIFGNNFGSNGDKVLNIPTSITTLEFGASFNKFIKPFYFPDTLKTLKFGKQFKQSLQLNSIPSSVTYLVFHIDYKPFLRLDKIPKTVKKLKFLTPTIKKK